MQSCDFVKSHLAFLGAEHLLALIPTFSFFNFFFFLRKIKAIERVKSLTVGV